MKSVYHGQVVGGKLKIANRKLFDRDISLLDGKHIEIVISPRRRTRSEQQNRYYWGVVIAMAKDAFIELGHEDISSEDVHDFFKNRFNNRELINENTAEVLTIPQSTASLTTVDFMTYIDKCVKFGAETLNIQIPSPNEQTSIWT
jgi:hypothetical protein